MSKLTGEPVKVHWKEDPTITAFIWRKRLYRVNEVINWWRPPAKETGSGEGGVGGLGAGSIKLWPHLLQKTLSGRLACPHLGHTASSRSD